MAKLSNPAALSKTKLRTLASNSDNLNKTKDISPATEDEEAQVTNKQTINFAEMTRKRPYFTPKFESETQIVR